VADSVVLITRKRAARKRPDRVLPVVGKGRSHIHRAIEKLEGGPYYTVSELAFLIERDLKTVKKWIRMGKNYPTSKYNQLGTASKYIELYGELVYLYTPDDVERFRVFAESI
jgi:hypothetical protein